MEHLEYKIEIPAPAKKVWETMLQKETYDEWVAASWPDTSYEGKWGKGEQIKFAGKEGSGTLAEIVEFRPYELVLARHIAALGRGGVEDRESETAKSWIGSIEEYRFSEKDGKTTVTVHVETTPQWRAMFDEGWPPALEQLKRITERQLTTA